ncbi:hypothetical protein [Pendulispora albinea]|uniref:Uncharacterized protein n=1 Tax=Pendulispora albinea TaxID=2741071 RepID=A0ABZ2MD15_9BACT
MTLRHSAMFGWCILAACSAQSSGDGKTGRELHHRDDASAQNDAISENDAGSESDAGTEVDAGPLDGGDVDAGPPGTLTPSNLPPDICDTPGTKDLTIAPSDNRGFGIGCDAIIPQGNGLPDICMYKYANVTIAGKALALNFDKKAAVAIVATNAFTVTNTGVIEASGETHYTPRNGAGGPDPRGEARGGRGGAGHVTPGAGGTSGGAAYASTGNQLVAGARGGPGWAPTGSGWPDNTVPGGFAGGALQLVSCGRLEVHGTIRVNGSYGVSVIRGSGGGGGSGGTLLLEGAQIVTEGARLEALGGGGGSGGGTNCPGGNGGTGSTPPKDGHSGEGCWPGSAAGSGGSIGRISMNLPAGTPPPPVNADPPVLFGVVGTH